MDNLGFIITRHVNSERTNLYWNHSVKLIRTLYSIHIKIIIIDDNSNSEFVKNEHDYKNIIIINSEYPTRGELLPYIYYHKHKWFKRAVILHDSSFINKKINFNKIKLPVLPIWHFEKDIDDVDNTMRIVKYLKNSNDVIKKLNMVTDQIMNININNSTSWKGCFGVQCVIDLWFVEKLEEKYMFSNLINAVHCRLDRCALERIFACMFHNECSRLISSPSLMGDIQRLGIWGYTIEQYMEEFNQHKAKYAIMKVWTGR